MIHCFKTTVQERLDCNFYRKQSKLRFYAFGKLGWPVDVCREKETEEDVYDNDDTVYFLNTNRHGVEQASLRVCRTDVEWTVDNRLRSFLTKDVFSDHCENVDQLLTGEAYRDASRLCVNRELLDDRNKELRRWVVRELLYALTQYCLNSKIQFLYGVMPTRIHESTWGRYACEYMPLGKSFLDKHTKKGSEVELRVQRKKITRALRDRLASPSLNTEIISHFKN